VADCTAGAALLARMPACDRRHGDKAYDSNALRHQIENSGALPNIPPKANRKSKNCFSPFLNRNAIARMFCRLQDFRRVAPRYDRSAVNFLSAVCIAATVSYWLWVWTLCGKTLLRGNNFIITAVNPHFQTKAFQAGEEIDSASHGGLFDARKYQLEMIMK
jgi:transposase